MSIYIYFNEAFQENSNTDFWYTIEAEPNPHA